MADADSRFDWDDDNIEHIARHGLEPFEAEEALDDPHSFTYGVESKYEPRFVAVGSTQDGRVIAVVYTPRGRRLRVVTARRTVGWEIARYRRRGRK